MIRIAITSAAFEAIAATLPLGSVGYEPKVHAQGQRLVWLEPAVTTVVWTFGRGSICSERGEGPQRFTDSLGVN